MKLYRQQKFFSRYSYTLFPFPQWKQIFLELFPSIISKIVRSKILLQFLIFIYFGKRDLACNEASYFVSVQHSKNNLPPLSSLREKKNIRNNPLDFIAKYTKSKRHRGHWNHPACGVKKTSGKKVSLPLQIPFQKSPAQRSRRDPRFDFLASPYPWNTSWNKNREGRRNVSLPRASAIRICSFKRNRANALSRTCPWEILQESVVDRRVGIL